MVNFNYISDFQLNIESNYLTWINQIILSEDFVLGELNYVFCSDEYLHKINTKYLNHDTFTDIISFDYTDQSTVSGDIFISIERVKENSLKFSTSFDDELLRVMAHGILHFCGYKDKSEEDILLMRSKEQEKIQLFEF